MAKRIVLPRFGGWWCWSFTNISAYWRARSPCANQRCIADKGIEPLTSRSQRVYYTNHQSAICRIWTGACEHSRAWIDPLRPLGQDGNARYWSRTSGLAINSRTLWPTELTKQEEKNNWKCVCVWMGKKESLLTPCSGRLTLWRHTLATCGDIPLLLVATFPFYFAHAPTGDRTPNSSFKGSRDYHFTIRAHPHWDLNPESFD